MKLKRMFVAILPIALNAGQLFAQTVPADKFGLYGADPPNPFVDYVTTTFLPLVAPFGVQTYYGLGSYVGQRQMEGSPRPGEPSCGWTGSGPNPGCQEVAFMTSMMTSDICDDAESAGQAESLLVAFDGFVILSDNASHQQYSVGQCSGSVTPTPNPNGSFQDTGRGHLRASGTLPLSSYQVGAGFAAADRWKDVLRLALTGCSNSDGTCSSANRTTRCQSAARRELLSSWGALFEGTRCATGNCTNAKHIYRRDDTSGVARELLAKIGVADNGFPRRDRVLNGGGFPANIGAIPENFPYCDGGADEAYSPSTNGSDPVRVPCDPDDDLCGADGKTGVVQAIRTAERLGYPTQQCQRNRFARVPWVSSQNAICPDGTAPVGAACNLPYREVNGVRNFNCINRADSYPSSLSGVDGRVYNSVQRDSAGNVLFAGIGLPVAATYRQDMVNIDTGFSAGLSGKVYAPADVVCQETDATNNIGCLIAKSTCNLGVTSRGAAVYGSHALSQEPAVLGGQLPTEAAILNKTYPLTNGVYIAAIGGFEKLNEQCEARGHHLLAGAEDYCYAEYEYAVSAWTMGQAVRTEIFSFGYVPISRTYPNRCIGALGSAGCGAPTVQPLEACFPERPPGRGDPPDVEE